MNKLSEENRALIERVLGPVWARILDNGDTNLNRLLNAARSEALSSPGVGGGKGEGSSRERGHDLCADGSLPVLTADAGSAFTYADLPETLRSHVHYIEAALSTYSGGPAGHDVRVAWTAITDQLRRDGCELDERRKQVGAIQHLIETHGGDFMRCDACGHQHDGIFHTTDLGMFIKAVVGAHPPAERGASGTDGQGPLSVARSARDEHLPPPNPVSHEGEA